VHDFGLFEEVVSSVPFITLSAQPAYLELKPIYNFNPNNDIRVDAVWFFDGIPEEEQLPEGIPESDVCNQFYYDSVEKRWKYDRNRCDACSAGSSILFCMFKNLFRWALAKLTIWILQNILYFIVLLVLIILLAPLLIKWRQHR
jgi:hypothetical protein